MHLFWVTCHYVRLYFDRMGHFSSKAGHLFLSVLPYNDTVLVIYSFIYLFKKILCKCSCQLIRF